MSSQAEADDQSEIEEGEQTVELETRSVEVQVPKDSEVLVLPFELDERNAVTVDKLREAIEGDTVERVLARQCVREVEDAIHQVYQGIRYQG